MDYVTTLLLTGFVTSDTKRFVFSRPANFHWTPGQGVELVVNEAPWNKEGGRPFTPTGVAGDQALEFIIKRYPDHHGMTDRLHALAPGAQLFMSAPFGTINYKDQGTFIAAGSGITPFLAIFRSLAARGALAGNRLAGNRLAGNRLAGNRLIFSNKRPADIICEKELRYYFGDKALFVCTRDQAPGYLAGRIDKAFLEENVSDFTGHFYVCGPESFVEDVKRDLKKLGAAPESLVFEE